MLNTNLSWFGKTVYFVEPIGNCEIGDEAVVVRQDESSVPFLIRCRGVKRWVPACRLSEFPPDVTVVDESAPHIEDLI